MLWKQAEDLGMDSEDDSAKEKPHTYTVGEGKPVTSAAMFSPDRLSCPCCFCLYQTFWFVALHSLVHMKGTIVKMGLQELQEAEREIKLQWQPAVFYSFQKK